MRAHDDALSELDAILEAAAPNDRLERRPTSVVRASLRARVAALASRHPTSIGLEDERAEPMGYRDRSVRGAGAPRLWAQLEVADPGKSLLWISALVTAALVGLVSLLGVDARANQPTQLVAFFLVMVLVVSGRRCTRTRVRLTTEPSEICALEHRRGWEMVTPALRVTTDGGHEQCLEDPTPRELAEALPVIWREHRELVRRAQASSEQAR
jgi:hypothetical protein